MKTFKISVNEPEELLKRGFRVTLEPYIDGKWKLTIEKNSRVVETVLVSWSWIPQTINEIVNRK